MKKFISLLVVLCLLVGSVFALASCQTSVKEQKVMTVSCNPEVEFILDEDGKVVSVNAINDEGNLIISAQAGTKQFVGSTAEEATTLFVEIATETGYLVKGEASMEGNTLNIALSGNEETAKEIYNKVKTAVQTKLDESGLSTKIAEFQSVAESYIKEQLAKAESYLAEAEINKLSAEEMIDKLEASRKETADMLSQELKDLYYQAKNVAVKEATLEKAKEGLNALQKLALTGVQTLYDTASNLVTSTANNVLVNSDSIYQKALALFKEKKTEYVNFRAYLAEQTNVTENQETFLSQLDTAVESAENALKSAYDSAIASLKQLQESLDSAYNSLVEAIGELGVNTNNLLSDISANLSTTIDEFSTSFETTYATQITAAETSWQSMITSLKQGYQPQE